MFFISRPRLGSRLSLSSRLEKLSQGSIPSQDLHLNSAPSQPLVAGSSLPTSACTNPLQRAPLLARFPKNATPASADDNKDDGFDLLDGLLDDADEEEQENDEEHQPPLPSTNPLEPLQKLNDNTKSISATLQNPASVNVGLQRKINPFSRKIIGSSSRGGAGSAPRHVTLARQAPPSSIKVDSSAMLQSVLGPAMAFKKPAAAMRKEPPAQSKKLITKGSGGLKKKESRRREFIDDVDDDDDDFVKPAPKKPLLRRQIPLVKKPPGPLVHSKEEKRAAAHPQQVPSQSAVVLEQQQRPPLGTNIASTFSAAAAAPAGGGGGGGDTSGASQRFQAPRMTEPPRPLQHLIQQQQQQLQPQRPPLWTADILDLSKDDNASECHDAPVSAPAPLPESPSAAVWLPDPYQQQQQQQQIYRQPEIAVNDSQPQQQIWRAPEDDNMKNSAGDGTGGLFGGAAAPAAGEGIFAQAQQQQQALGGIFAPGPVQQQHQHHNDNTWNIPAIHNHPSNSSPHHRQQHQQQQQPAAPLGGGAAGSTEGGSWWYRLPDFVPVSVLQRGHNPRDGTVVHIDYKNQFSGKSGGGATAAAKKAARAEGAASKSRNRKTGNTAASNRNSGGSFGKSSTKGYWLTISGVKTYVDAKGKQLTGSAAWSASKKESEKATEGSSGGGRKSSKKAAGKRATTKKRR